MTIVSNPDAIRALQLTAQMGAVRMESIGMRHSGGNITPKLKKLYSLPRSATHADVLTKLRSERDILDERLGLPR